MRYLIALLLVLAVVASAQWQGVAPIGKNENDILYTWAGLDFDVYQEDVGIIGYRETALGADTLFICFDLDEDDYDHGELFIEFTADAADGNYASIKSTRNVALYFISALTDTGRTVTTGNKLSIVNMNSGGSVIEYVYRTLLPDAASYASKVMIDNLSGRTGESTGVLGPFWIEPTDGGGDTSVGFIAITADTVGLSWRAILIPRE